MWDLLLPAISQPPTGQRRRLLRQQAQDSLRGRIPKESWPRAPWFPQLLRLGHRPGNVLDHEARPGSVLQHELGLIPAFLPFDLTPTWAHSRPEGSAHDVIDLEGDTED